MCCVLCVLVRCTRTANEGQQNHHTRNRQEHTVFFHCCDRTFPRIFKAQKCMKRALCRLYMFYCSILFSKCQYSVLQKSLTPLRAPPFPAGEDSKSNRGFHKPIHSRLTTAAFYGIMKDSKRQISPSERNIPICLISTPSSSPPPSRTTCGAACG